MEQRVATLVAALRQPLAGITPGQHSLSPDYRGRAPMFKDGSSDHLLVHQILQGSQEAANALFYRYYDRIFHFLLLNRVSNREDARDLTQDTFRKAWENLASLR